MTPAHLSAAVGAAIRSAVDDGELPLPAAGPHCETADLVPVDGDRPGAPDADYLSPAPLRLAAAAGRAPADVAPVLASRLRRLPDLAGVLDDVTVTAHGHCALRLRPDARAAILAAVVTTGPAYAHSRTLDGASATAARAGNLARAADLDQARRWLVAEVTGALTEAAGGHVTWTGPEVVDTVPGRESPVAALLAAAGTGGARYALLSTAPGATLDTAHWARAHTSNPAYAVRYAHAHAAGLLRQAADLGLTPGRPEDLRGDLISAPAERALITAIADLPRRIALAARPSGRTPAAAEAGRPELVARYLDGIAGAYLGWQGTVLPRGDEKPGVAHVARLWLAAGVRTALAAGLELLGVPAPARM